MTDSQRTDQLVMHRYMFCKVQECTIVKCANVSMKIIWLYTIYITKYVTQML